MKLIRVLLAALLISCSSSPLKSDKEKVIQTNQEFDQIVKIQTPSESSLTSGPTAHVGNIPTTAQTESAKKIKKTNERKSKNKKQESPVHESKGPAVPQRSSDDIEDSEGFIGRRPVVDPFKVGERVVHEVSYFAITAGTLTFSVEPMVQVNGRHSYQFSTEIKTYPNFSRLVYAVEDKAVTWLDYDLLIPRVFSLHVKESSQLREARSYFDFDKLEATYWEKKITEKNGVEEKKQKWTILPWSQNIFSAIFYMRLFKWDIGKEYAFRVADDEKNLVFKGTALRKERLKTKVGEFPAIVIRPQITMRNKFQQTGDILIWLSDDDRKLVLRIETKIKIGTLVSEVISLNY